MLILTLGPADPNIKKEKKIGDEDGVRKQVHTGRVKPKFLCNSHVPSYNFHALVQVEQHLHNQQSDLLRLLLLQKFGGAFLDADTVSMGPVPTDIPNFIMSGEWVGAGGNFFDLIAGLLTGGSCTSPT